MQLFDHWCIMGVMGGFILIVTNFSLNGCSRCELCNQKQNRPGGNTDLVYFIVNIMKHEI